MKRRLGTSDIEWTAIGLGCWQFSEGKGLVGRMWEALAPSVVDEIVTTSLKGGIDWFDTAEAYGNGASERALSRALSAAGARPGQVHVATKWMSVGKTAASLLGTIDQRLACLFPFPIALHQVHQPYTLSSSDSVMNAMAELVKRDRIRTVGVSNYGARRMRDCNNALAVHNLPLVANQVKYSLLDRRIESNGVMAAAKELGITIIAYSPLEQGLLSGKFHDDPKLIASRVGFRKYLPGFKAAGLERSRPLIDELRKIASAHGATASQVALAWLLAFHGDTVVAIPGATRAKHVEENVGAMALKLSDVELKRIDELSRPFL